jgi:hypothetical protein
LSHGCKEFKIVPNPVAVKVDEPLDGAVISSVNVTEVASPDALASGIAAEFE